jgi:hypothetical protein
MEMFSSPDEKHVEEGSTSELANQATPVPSFPPAQSPLPLLLLRGNQTASRASPSPARPNPISAHKRTGTPKTFSVPPKGVTTSSSSVSQYQRERNFTTCTPPSEIEPFPTLEPGTELTADDAVTQSTLVIRPVCSKESVSKSSRRSAKPSEQAREELRQVSILSAEQALNRERIEVFEWQNTALVSGSSIVYITNGSLISFCGEGFVSEFIRNRTREGNPLGLSHVGVALVGTPSEMVTIVQQIYACGTIRSNGDATEQSAIHMLQQLSELDPDSPDVFCAHSTKDWGVHIDRLFSLIEEYDGQVYIRPLTSPVPLAEMYPMLVLNLGRKYKLNVRSFLGCIHQNNKRTDNITQFCSQFVTNVYKHCQMIPRALNALNVSPARFGSFHDQDLLRDHAEKEILIKYRPVNSGGNICCEVY